MSEQEKTVAYKAFNDDFTCRGFPYRVGETYTHDGEVEICKSGFHACLYPIDVLNYYPATSRFALVQIGGVQGEQDGDTKICGAEITIKTELHIHEMVEAAVKYVFDAAKWIKGTSATGISGAASATGDSGAAMASGYKGVSMGADGCALFLCERNVDDTILAVWAGIAGRDGIKPDTWYRLEGGDPVEA